MGVVNVERDLHMTDGDGETSYAKNSRLQEQAMSKVKPILAKATREAYAAHLPKTMVVADLGCSSGPNTLLFVREVLSTVADHRGGVELGSRRAGGHVVQLQFFLNDLPGNDFNQLFRSLEQFGRSTARSSELAGAAPPPPFFVLGLPGSYYSRLFPSRSVHLFHSSYCLQWRSKVPEGLEAGGGACRNEGNVYITETTPAAVVELFQEQFRRDLSLFLRLRHEELAAGGRMVLTFPGRKNKDAFTGDFSRLFGLLTASLQSLVAEGVVEKQKLDSFNLPMYGPSVAEAKAVVKRTGLFAVDHVRLFHQNWDPFDDSDAGAAAAQAQAQGGGGANVARCIRAVTAPLIASHFGVGEGVLDALFADYASRVARHLERASAKYAVIVLSLKKKKERCTAVL